MTKSGQRLVPKRGNSLAGFTAFKAYEVVAGAGDANLSPAAAKLGVLFHSDTSANVIDDNGKMRFVTLNFFAEFKSTMGTLFNG